MHVQLDTPSERSHVQSAVVGDTQHKKVEVFAFFRVCEFHIIITSEEVRHGITCNSTI